MFLELIATFVAGFAGAGVVMIVNVMVGRRLPKWMIPIGAGAAMLTTAISNEYGWYGRTVDALPDGVVVATTVEDTAFYRPWTYVWPYIGRFIAVDTLSTRTNDAVPDHRIVDLIVFGRWAPVRKFTVMIDCATARRADLMEGVSFGDNGEVIGADWAQMSPDDPVITATCGGAL